MFQTGPPMPDDWLVNSLTLFGIFCLGGIVVLNAPLLVRYGLNFNKELVKQVWEMATRKRRHEKVVRFKVATLLTDMFEDAIHRGDLKHDDAMRWYYKIGKACNMRDLLPTKVIVHPNTDDLKEEIRDRLNKSTDGQTKPQVRLTEI